MFSVARSKAEVHTDSGRRKRTSNVSRITPIVFQRQPVSDFRRLAVLPRPSETAHSVFLLTKPWKLRLWGFRSVHNSIRPIPQYQQLHRDLNDTLARSFFSRQCGAISSCPRRTQAGLELRIPGPRGEQISSTRISIMASRREEVYTPWRELQPHFLPLTTAAPGAYSRAAHRGLRVLYSCRHCPITIRASFKE